MSNITVIEHCRVPPPPSAARKSLPLTALDITWINLIMKSLFFYDLPKSKSNTTYFTQTLIPALKLSLSLTLKHFYPLAGKLIIPASTNKPEIHCSGDDSVSLTFAECCSVNHDIYNHLSGNHAKSEDELFLLVPKLLPAGCSNYSPDWVLPQLFALQVTLFPGHGISIGITNDHTIGDATTIFTFLRAWSSIAKLGGDDNMPLSFLPFYDRSVLKERKEVNTRAFVEKMEQEKKNERSSPPVPLARATKVRATFVMNRADIQGLKDKVLTKLPTLPHVSSFTVACGHVWACMANARMASGEKMRENQMESFIFPMDCRARLVPPIPETYVGNCLAPCFATVKTMDLVGGDQSEGFVIAAKSFGEAISANLHNKEEEGGVFKGEDKWGEKFQAAIGNRIYGISGSARSDFYGIDFGWGRPKKVEVVTAQFSLCKSKDLEGGLEIGLCLPENEMDAFASIFAKTMK